MKDPPFGWVRVEDFRASLRQRLKEGGKEKGGELVLDRGKRRRLEFSSIFDDQKGRGNESARTQKDLDPSFEAGRGFASRKEGGEGSELGGGRRGRG